MSRASTEDQLIEQPAIGVSSVRGIVMSYGQKLDKSFQVHRPIAGGLIAVAGGHQGAGAGGRRADRRKGSAANQIGEG